VQGRQCQTAKLMRPRRTIELLARAMRFGRRRRLVVAAAAWAMICSVGPALAQAPPSASASFSPAVIAPGGVSLLTITITNPNPATTQTGLHISDLFPGGMIGAPSPNLNNTCGGATSGGGYGAHSFGLNNGTLAPNSSCTISTNVTAISTVTNTTSTVRATQGGNGNAASATLTVSSLSPPTVTQAFGTGSTTVGGTTSLTITITNPNAGSALSGLAFTDNLPAGLVVATPSALSSTCGGTASAGGGTASLSGGTLAASGSCVVTLNVTATSAGTKSNTIASVTSNEAPSDTSATATLSVSVGSTGTTLTSSLNPSASGQAVTFTATVVGTSRPGR
jgi:Domain of unknown function DUF11